MALITDMRVCVAVRGFFYTEINEAITIRIKSVRRNELSANSLAGDAHRVP